MYYKYAIFEGSQRWRYSDDLYENARLAIARLVCDGCAADFGRIVDQARAIFDSAPAVSFLLKKTDHKMHYISGAYTLFNRMRLRHPDDFNIIFEKRIHAWLDIDKSRFDVLLEKNKIIADRIPKWFGSLQAVDPEFKRSSFTDFLLGREWGTSGTVEFKVLDEFTKSKMAWAMQLTDAELLQWWAEHADDSDVNKVFQKQDETAAFRLIVAAPLQSYLKMCFIAKDLEAAVSHDPHMWTFWSQRKKLNIQKELQTKLQSGWWSINCDGSGWDEGIGFSITEAFFTCAQRRYADCDPAAKLDTLWSHNISKGVCVLPDGSSIPYKNGVLSGWRFTLLINSIVNSELMRLTAPPGGLWIVQGDDNTTLMPDKPDMAVYADWYDRVGFKLNQSKSTVMEGEYEFLKMVVTPLRATGLPVRGLRSILFGSSQMERDKNINVWNQRSSLWCKFASRMMAGPDEYKNEMFQDAMRASPPTMRCDRQLYLSWLDSPLSLGGGGFGDTPKRWKFNTTEVLAKEQPTSLPPVPHCLPRSSIIADGWRRRLEGILKPQYKNKAEFATSPVSHSVDLLKLKKYSPYAVSATSWFLQKFIRFKPIKLFSLGLGLGAVRNLKEIKSLVNGLSLGPEAMRMVAEVSTRYSSGLAFSLLTKGPPSGFSPKCSLAWGEQTAELVAGITTDFALAIAPAKASTHRLEEIIASLLPLV